MKKPRWAEFGLKRLGELRLKSLLARHAALVLVVVTGLCVIGLVDWASYKEESTDWDLTMESWKEAPKTYRINILSVDEVAGKVQTNVQLILDRFSFVSNPKIKGPINGGFLVNDLDVQMGPLKISDLGPNFQVIGFMTLSTLTEGLTPVAPTPDLTRDTPPVSQTEFSLLGEPKFYPYDRYFVIGSVSSVVLASADKKEFFGLDRGHYEFYLRAPNFVMRAASNRELLALPRNAKISNSQETFLKQFPAGREKMFAVVLERPLFLRFMTGFMLAAAVFWAVCFVFVSEFKTFLSQPLSYFVGLWAIRQILLSGGPRVFTVVDYAVLSLYAALILLMIAKTFWNKKDGRTESVRQT